MDLGYPPPFGGEPIGKPTGVVNPVDSPVIVKTIIDRWIKGLPSGSQTWQWKIPHLYIYIYTHDFPIKTSI